MLCTHITVFPITSFATFAGMCHYQMVALHVCVTSLTVQLCSLSWTHGCAVNLWRTVQKNLFAYLQCECSFILIRAKLHRNGGLWSAFIGLFIGKAKVINESQNRVTDSELHANSAYSFWFDLHRIKTVNTLVDLRICVSHTFMGKWHLTCCGWWDGQLL